MPSTAKLISRVHLRRGVATRWGGEEGERKNNTRPHWIHAAPRATRLVRLASQSRLSLPGNIAAMHTHTYTHARVATQRVLPFRNGGSNEKFLLVTIFSMTIIILFLNPGITLDFSI